MAALSKATHVPKLAEEVNLTNSVLDLSIIVGFIGADVIKSDIKKLDRVLYT